MCLLIYGFLTQPSRRSFSSRTGEAMQKLSEAIKAKDEEEALHILLQVPRPRDYVEWKEF